MDTLPTSKDIQAFTGRIWHADALDLLRALPDASVSLIVSDPPYGNDNGVSDLAGARARDGVKGGRRKGEIKRIENDDIDSWSILMPQIFREANRVIKPNGTMAFFVGGGGGTKTHFAQAILWLEEIASFFHAVIWDKSKRGYGMGWRYRRNYEMILIAGKKGHSIGWAKNRKAQPNVVNFRPTTNELHPTQKPQALIEWLILNHSEKGDIVLDPFIGSGTTASAAQRLERCFIGCDLDFDYVTTSRNRLNEPMQLSLFRDTE